MSPKVPVCEHRVDKDAPCLLGSAGYEDLVPSGLSLG